MQNTVQNHCTLCVPPVLLDSLGMKYIFELFTESYTIATYTCSCTYILKMENPKMIYDLYCTVRYFLNMFSFSYDFDLDIQYDTAVAHRKK